jgi:hypothetical protein
MSNEFIVKNGLIVGGNVVTSGTITINGALAATQSWVTSQAYLTSASLSGYATQSYVTSALAALVDAAPAALDTLNELAAALGDDANFSTTITNSIAAKQAQLNGTGLVRMSGTSVSYDNTTYLISNFGNIEGEHGYGYPSSDGWYKIAEIVLTSSCQSFNLWGEYRDTGYFDNSHYRIHITARAECDFPTNNESHAINVNMYGSSTNETYFNNNVRVVLTSSSSNYRKYELQYYRATWDTGSWNLQTLGWTTYTTSQTAGTPTGTPRVYYISKFVADNIYAANKISIGTTYSGFAANIAGTTYVIGASVWVNDGYGISNASSGGTGFFPYSDGTLVFNSVNSEKMRVAPSGNVGIGTNSPSALLDVNGRVIVGGGLNGNAFSIATSIGTYTFNNYNLNTPSSFLITAGSSGYLSLDGYPIIFKVLGSETMRVHTSGNIGIGTDSPTHLLSLSRATQAAAYQLNINNAGGISDGNFTGIRFSQDSNAATELGNIKLHYYSTGATDLSFGTRYSPTALYIQSGGNVGIGTTGPEAKLHIVSGASQAGFLSRGTNGDTWFPYSNGQNYVRGVTNFDSGSVYFTGGNIGIGTTSPSHKLHIKSSSLNSYPLVVQRAANTNNIFYIYEDGSGNGTLTLENSGGGAAVSIKSDGTSYLNGGNVGIGTTDPTSQMSGTFGIGIYNALYPAVGFKNSTTAWLWYGQDSTFRMWNATFGDILTANTSGNIGIGTGSPSTKLDVNGVITATGGNSTNWNTAFGWGNHASAGYLTSYSETDTLQSVTNRGATTTNRLEFQYSVDRYSQAWRNNTTGAYWWVTTDADKLGFHRNGDGDKFYFSNAGDFYSTTNGWLSTALAAKQNASTAITTSNIGSQSVSYANNAGYAAEAGQVINQSGQLLRFDNRTISPSETTAGYLQFGFTSWGNDNSSPYADYLHMRSYTDGSGGSDNLVMFLKSGIGMRIYQQTFGSATAYSSYADVWTSANFTSTNVSNWNTAYSWGNHASASYATTSYVTTQINNLINGAPGALDTLDELAAALGDDANFATTVTNSIAGKVSKAGDTMTGNINWDTQNTGLTWNMNTDGAYIKFFNTGDGDTNSRLEYSTSDNGDEYHRWVIAGVEKMNLKWGGLTVTDTIYASGGNSGNWNTAYGWGNHASAGYALNSSLANYLPLSGGVIGGGVTINGNLTVNGTITENSSLKLKENVETSEGNLEKVVNLRPVTYNKIGSQTTELGLIAEEVAEVYPEFVQYDENGEPIGVHYSRLTAALIGAVKELTNQVQELNKKING